MVERPSSTILPDGTPCISPPPGFGWDEGILQPPPGFGWDEGILQPVVVPIMTTLQMCGFDPQPVERPSVPSMEEPAKERSLLETVKDLLGDIVAQQQRQGELLVSLQMQMDGSHRQRRSSAWCSKVPRSCQRQWREFDGQSTPTTVYYSPSSFQQVDSTTAVEEAILPTPPPDVKSAQIKDTVISRVVELKSSGQKQPSPHQLKREPGAVKRLLHSWDNLEIKEGTLCYRQGKEEPVLEVLPKTMMWPILHSIQALFNIKGFRELIRLARLSYFWP
ncbi:uncharacterized protein [Asterias amurensis]|uniref:uncharacterized protein n=1 Tax=Asterias amurensis TaxID=7602 RepID=UPI003AB830BF